MRKVAIAVGAGVLLLALGACSTTVAGKPQDAVPAAAHPATPAGPPAKASAPPAARAKAAVRVHATLLESDHQTYGVGMPIVMRFTKRVTDAAAFERAVTVTVDGQPAAGAWHFEPSQVAGFVVEAHYRAAHFWPAHSHIRLAAPLKDVSAGAGRVFDDSLTLSIDIGAEHISTVDAGAHPHMTVRSGGRVVRTLEASLGAADHPTYRGTKIVQEFDRVENMSGTPVPWSVRVTNSGEFVHAAPWNGQLGRANLSHGCTNLSTADAEWFFHFSQLGDVVEYPNAPGGLLRPDDGLGDWNVPWSQWPSGGLR